MMLSTKATGAEFTICASGNVSYVRRRGKDGAAMAGSSRPKPEARWHGIIASKRPSNLLNELLCAVQNVIG
jgi:hypothetical protein